MGRKKEGLGVNISTLVDPGNGSKITDPWEVVDDHKRHTCDKCRKEKSVKEFVIYCSKYNPKLSKVCRICNGYRRFENERRKRGEFKEEWY